MESRLSWRFGRSQYRPREAYLDEHREEFRAQIAEGVLQAERGELVDGEEATERLRRDLDELFGKGWGG